MRPSPFFAGVLLLLSVPASAGVSSAAYAATDAAYGLLVPQPGPTAILLRGLFAVWSALLFCWLVELATGAAGHVGSSLPGSRVRSNQTTLPVG